MPVGGEAASSSATDANAVPVGGAQAFTSREEMKKQRELEEARKSGLIPAEKDEEGRDINPHIPQYIAKAPWYLNQDHPSLKHQRFKAEQHSSIKEWYKRGARTDEEAKAVKFAKGACENCGARTHQAKDCTDRPRKRKARYTGRDLHPDEFLNTDAGLDLDYDGKRDRYGGYDPNAYHLIISDFEKADLERKRRKAEEIQEQIKEATSRRKKRKLRKRLSRLDAKEGDDNAENVDEGGSDDSGDSDSDSDTDGGASDDEDARIRDFDHSNAPVGTKDDRTRTTTRNLRIREDTAKYLFNLDVSSAFYDPKTRSMRDNPLKHLKEEDQVIFRGDNSARRTGEADSVTRMEVFAWEAYKHGSNVHSQAQPTQLELLYQQHLDKKKALVTEKQEELIHRYGGREHLGAPKGLLFSQSEAYVEYGRDGTVKKGRERGMAKSKYEEDVYPANHSSVWGSWFCMNMRRWGFACCRSTDRYGSCGGVEDEKKEGGGGGVE